MREQQEAIIVEIRGRKAAALTRDGAFLRVPNRRYAVGQTVTLDLMQPADTHARTRMRLNSYVSMVAGLLLLVLGGWIGYMAPVGVVSLDVNPSLEYTINCFDRVLDVAAVNEDAAALLEGMNERDLLYCSVDDALEQTVLALREEGYLTATSVNNVVISAYSYNEQHTEQIADRLSRRIGSQSDLSVYAVPVSKDEVKSAHSLGTTAGKLHMIERLDTVWGEEDISSAEDWIDQPMRRILRETELQEKAQKLGEKGESPADDKQPQTPGNDKNEKDEKDEKSEKDGDRNRPEPDDGQTDAGEQPDAEQGGQPGQNGHTP